MSQTEMAEHIRRICGATDLPVIADADTGYGGILNAQRTVELWEAAGASGLHIEDQVSPKRCGHIAGKAVIPTAEMVQKIKAVLDARRDASFFVIARTDALAVTGLDDAIARCKAFAMAGADALFVDAPESEAQLKTIARELQPTGKPLLFNSARTGKSPFLSEARLHELGFDIVIYPIEAMLAAHAAVKRIMRSIITTGGADAAAGSMTTFQEFNELIGLGRYIEKESNYAG
jgi:methylisocitrate lyase